MPSKKGGSKTPTKVSKLVEDPNSASTRIKNQVKDTDAEKAAEKAAKKEAEELRSCSSGSGRMWSGSLAPVKLEISCLGSTHLGQLTMFLRPLSS
jgi:hypothetical protein